MQLPASAETRPAALGADARVLAFAEARFAEMLAEVWNDFRRDVIELIGDDNRFRIVTPDGTFELSSGEFRREFENVRRSRSYREGGVYHYRSVPAKALRFLESTSDGVG